MDCLLKKHFLLLCILQIATTIYSEEISLEQLKMEEDVQYATLSSEILKQNEYQEIDIEELEATKTTILPQIEEQELSSSSCLDKCLKESNEKLCVCDCDSSCLQPTVEFATSATIEQTEDEMEEENHTEGILVDEPTLVACPVVGHVKATTGSCDSYALCVPTEKGLYWSEQQCPTGTAFNSVLRRCARDLQACMEDQPQCTHTGTFRDVGGNNSYIWCIPKRTEQGWHKYRVRCADYEVFVPALGSCFIDAQKLSAGVLFRQEARDVDVIKAELAELKVLEKQLLKEEKVKMKLHKKQEKLMIKTAIKEAQERAKLEGADSSEYKGFACLQEGAFASILGEQFYNNCVLKKGKLKALTMMCAPDLKFNEDIGMCMSNI